MDATPLPHRSPVGGGEGCKSTLRRPHDYVTAHCVRHGQAELRRTHGCWLWHMFLLECIECPGKITVKKPASQRFRIFRLSHGYGHASRRTRHHYIFVLEPWSWNVEWTIRWLLVRVTAQRWLLVRVTARLCTRAHRLASLSLDRAHCGGLRTRNRAGRIASKASPQPIPV